MTFPRTRRDAGSSHLPSNLTTEFTQPLDFTDRQGRGAKFPGHIVTVPGAERLNSGVRKYAYLQIVARSKIAKRTFDSRAGRFLNSHGIEPRSGINRHDAIRGINVVVRQAQCVANRFQPGWDPILTQLDEHFRHHHLSLTFSATAILLATTCTGMHRGLHTRLEASTIRQFHRVLVTTQHRRIAAGKLLKAEFVLHGSGPAINGAWRLDLAGWPRLAVPA